MNTNLSSYQDLTDAATNLRKYKTEMDTLLNTTIKNNINKIGEGSDIWSGDAAENAKQKFNKIAAKFPDFVKSVEDCAAYLEQVRTDFQNADTAARNAINNL